MDWNDVSTERLVQAIENHRLTRRQTHQALASVGLVSIGMTFGPKLAGAAAEDHPNADRLLVLTVDIGDGSSRQLVAGIKGSYQAADLIGKHVVVVANMKPAKLRGIESQGMVLAASEGDTVVLVSPERPIRAGSTVK